MKALKYTKGPWGYGQCNDGAEKRWFIGSSVNDIALVSIYNDTKRPEAEHAANAQLIAAAPQLAEALNMLYENVAALLGRNHADLASVKTALLAAGYTEEA